MNGMDWPSAAVLIIAILVAGAFLWKFLDSL